MKPSSNPNAIHHDVLILKSIVAMPLMKLPASSVALRTTRGVILISPGKNVAEHSEKIQNFGRVTDLVAPNLFHHLGIFNAEKSYPQATVWCTEGLQKKRPDIQWDKILSQKSWTYSDEIIACPILGTPKMNEWVFFHLASKTLIVTDLFFNLLHAKGIGAWIILKLFGTYKKFGISSFYLRMATDRDAFKKSLRDIGALDFSTIVMSHGEPITVDAQARFKEALKERDLL